MLSSTPTPQSPVLTDSLLAGATTLTFGAWLKTRRRALGVTQKELATRAGCAEITIRKIEANDLRPSKRLARVLLQKLRVPRGEQQDLIQRARGRP